MQNIFAGKTVVVTGAGRGIGAATARRFSKEGANVVVADVDRDSAVRVAAGLPRSMAVHVDVRSRDSVGELVAEASARFGGIDVLVNNAATCSDTPFLDIDPEDVRRDIEVSLLGPFYTSQAVIPGMIQRGGGVILNLASVNGLSFFGNEAYSAAKAGLISLTKSVAIQFGGAGIRCNAVAPGSVETEAWADRRRRDPGTLARVAQAYPLGRIGSTADVADALVFLASDRASWITGVVLPVDGGILTGNLDLARAITGN